MIEIIIKVLFRIPILNKISIKYTERKNEKILKFLKEKYYYIINKYNNKDKYEIDSNRIWVMWWQGENKAPKIVKNCIKRLKEYSNEVTVISKDNIYDYINIEKVILDKLEKNIITKTHFSDIVRMKLLEKYGGYWIDSTVFLTDNIIEIIKGKRFYTPKLRENKNLMFISKGKWCGYFIGGKDVKLYKFANDFFSEYWKNENELIDYFLIDYVINIAYEQIPDIKEMIDGNSFNNLDIYRLNQIKNRKFNGKIAEKLLNKNMVHKLSYKDKLKEEKKNTYYAKIINNI